MQNILIVEDEALISRYLAKTVSLFGYTVAGRVYNGKDALRVIDNQKPDLVLMDIQLQGSMDGISTALKIEEKFQLPVIFISAFNDRKTIAKVSSTNAYGFLKKPIDPHTLEIVISGALGQYNQTV